MEREPRPEIMTAADFRRKLTEIHEEFLERAPNYDKTTWTPEAALKKRTGSCMAELLYVAGTLLNDGLLSEEDISVGFSQRHGSDETVGLVGKTAKYYAHTFMLVTIQGEVYECDFRANTAEEKPQMNRVIPEEVPAYGERLFVGSLDAAMYEYGHRVGTDDSLIPTVGRLMALHQPFLDPDQAEVRFDLDF